MSWHAGGLVASSQLRHICEHRASAAVRKGKGDGLTAVAVPCAGSEAALWGQIFARHGGSVSNLNVQYDDDCMMDRIQHDLLSQASGRHCDH